MKRSRRDLPPPSSLRRRGARRAFLVALLSAACLLLVIAAGATRTPKPSASADVARQQRPGVEDDTTARVASAAPQEAASDAAPLSAGALQQIEAAVALKNSRTPAQQKIDSQLLFELKRETGELAALNLASVQTDVAQTSEGRVLVDITADVTGALLGALRAAGGEVVAAVPNYRSVRAEVSLEQVEAIAGLPEVTFIQPAQEATTWRANAAGSPLRVTGNFAARAERVKQLLEPAIAPSQDAYPVSVKSGTGERVSEGDRTHEADRARGTFNVNGAGIKIGVLSDGVGGLAEAQSRGELPAVTVLPGQSGASGSEGTAMLEIVHDIAPGAQLFFATALTGTAQFAQNIRDLRAAGCDIIVDDVGYFLESPFQDGQAPTVNSTTNGAVIAQAVIDVTNAGAVYFASAGNAGNLNDGTSGVWEGDFNDSGADLVVGSTNVGRMHLFTVHPAQPAPTPTPASATFNTITGTPSPASPINLFWSDPLGGSSNDYDLYVTNAAGTALVGLSNNLQNGTQDPSEQVTSAVNVSGNRIIVVKTASAAARYLHLNTNRGRLRYATPGQTKGHSTAELAYGTAATPAVGPFPSPFNSSNVVETFESDGPRRLFFNADGSPKTPGNFSSTGGIVRQKPDVTAADGVSVTGASGFGNPFFGTSAAAPHGAAITALLKQAMPNLSQAQIRNALTVTAIDIEAPGVDRDSGAGIIMPFAALQAAGATGYANPELFSVTPAEVGGNTNGFIESGEGGTLNIVLENNGLQAATGVTATLSTSTPGVSITPPAARSFPDIPVSGTSANASPYAFAITGDSCPSTIDFTLTVSSGGRPAPKVINFTLFTGPGANLSSALDATPPSNGTFYTATSGTQTGRLVRDGLESNCQTRKDFPGINDTSNRRYEAFTFVNPSSAPACVTIRLYGPLAGNLHVVAYGGTYSNTSLISNREEYLGDAGSSSSVKQFTVNLPGSTNLIVVVNDVNTGITATIPYTLEVTGMNPACAAAPANQPPVNTVPGPQTTAENTPLVFSAANGNAVSVADPDAGSNPLKVTLTAANGTITLDGTTGLSFSAGDGTADATMTFTGTAADINNALDGMTFNPTPGYSGTGASLTITTDDQGFTGDGGPQSDTDTVNITVNDGGAFEFAQATYTITEGGALGVLVTVNRTGGSAGAATVDFATSDGTATAGQDYTDADTTLSFADGETSKSVNIPVANDALFEADETVNLTLSNPTGSGALGAQTTAVLTIVNDDAAPSLAIDDVTLAEGNSGTTSFTFTVTKTGPTALVTTVNYATADGTAQDDNPTSEDSDYAPASGTLTFAAGETTKTVTVNVNGDTISEADETFFVNLSSPSNATVSDAQGLGTILNDDSPTFEFSQATFTAGEAEHFVTVTVTRTGLATTAQEVSYATSDGTATQRKDYTAAFGRLRFAAGEASKTFVVLLTDDAFEEAAETFNLTLSNPTGGAILGGQSTATVTIVDNDTPPSLTNPIDRTDFFVRQHYHDFLNREPDPSGFAFWQNEIESCGTNAQCREVKRINVSAAFFLSIEFQNSGYFVYRAFAAAFGPTRVGSTVPLTFLEFLPDTQQVGRGVVIGQPGAEALLEANKNAYVLEFVQRPAFVAQYPNSMTPAQFVDALNANTGNSLTASERNALVAQLTANNTTQGRADVLRQVIDNDAFESREFRRAFVLMQYFGYLRRNPNDPPDADFSGYNFWLQKLNDFNGDFIKAEMVKAFITSAEYRQRFGQN